MDITAEEIQEELQTPLLLPDDEIGNNNNLLEPIIPPPDDNNVNDEENVLDLADKVFSNPIYSIWKIASPIIISDVSVTKDRDNTNDGDHAPPGAPNFATAMLGTRLAQALDLTSPPPPSYNSTAFLPPSPYVLNYINMLLLPGEATLIIGPSSSGKSTLLRTLSKLIEGKQSTLPNIRGSVTVGGIDPSFAPQNFLRTTAVAEQGDLTLTPILTVEETVTFALQCSEGGDASTTQSAVRDLLTLAGLSHVSGTVVGDAAIRGVSGGQKRRVKMLEMANGSNLRALLLDEITNGLDAASALSLCRVVAACVKGTGLCAVVALLQPSVEVYETFRRVVVLNGRGECVYSGLRADALSYFERELGLIKPKDMDVPEFLLRAAFAPEPFTPGGNPGDGDNASTAANLPRLFLGSETKQALTLEADYATKQHLEKHPTFTAVNIPPFALSTTRQIRALCSRGMKLVVRNPASLMRIGTALLFGLFIGTLFLNTPDDGTGTQTRSGYVLTMLFMLFLTSCMSPLEDHFHDRLTFYAHREASFYRTSSYYIANVLYNTPVTLLEASFLSVLSFFFVGMSGGFVGFMYFWVMACFMNLNGLAISRILSYSMPTADMAASLGPAVLLLFVLTAGYSPQYADLPGLLRWLSWISPCSYAYEGMIVNEVYRRNVVYDMIGRNGNVMESNMYSGNEFGKYMFGIPRVPYDSAPPGLNTPQEVMAFDFFMLLILTVLFEVLGCVILHKSIEWYGPTTKRYQISSGMSLQFLPSLFTSFQKSFSRKSSSRRSLSSLYVPKSAPIELTAFNIVYEVDIPIEKKESNSIDQQQEQDPSRISNILLDEDDDRRTLRTSREYGQSLAGATQNWMLSRTLGSDALSASTLSSTSSKRSKRRTSSITPVSGSHDTVNVFLPPVEPGRLRLLSSVTAVFRPGTLTALMGSSGAGKSTLLDVLAGYKTGGHITGTMKINGIPKTDETWKSIAGYCEQVDCHNPALTVRESLIFSTIMRLKPYGAHDVKKKYANEIMELLELEEFADVLVGDEAAGEGLPKHARKRLTVGVELAANPSILFADEPTSGLDSISAKLVVNCLKRAKSKGLTIVCTIHQPSRDVFLAFDNLLLLRKGGVTTYNGPISGINEYIVNTTNDRSLALRPKVNPADYVLDIFCGPRGKEYDWGQLYKQSTMAQAAHAACSDDAGLGSEMSSSIANSFGSPLASVDIPFSGSQPLMSELWNVTYRQLLSHWRTPTYMAVRLWWTIAASIIVGVIYVNSPQTMTGVTNRLGAFFFYVNIATVPLMSAAVPLISERAVYYREIASGTYRRMVYGVAVQLAEIPFNMVAAIISWVFFYFLVGLDVSADRMGYFVLMTLASYWLLPSLGQLFSFLSPNIGAATGLGSLLMTLFSLTMGFLIPADKIPAWYIWLYWINPLRYMLQGMLVNEVGGGKWYAYNTPDGDSLKLVGDEVLEGFGWSYNQRWWYCYVAVLIFALLTSVGIILSTRISWLKR